MSLNETTRDDKPVFSVNINETRESSKTEMKIVSMLNAKPQEHRVQ